MPASIHLEALLPVSTGRCPSPIHASATTPHEAATSLISSRTESLISDFPGVLNSRDGAKSLHRSHELHQSSTVQCPLSATAVLIAAPLRTSPQPAPGQASDGAPPASHPSAERHLLSHALAANCHRRRQREEIGALSQPVCHPSSFLLLVRPFARALIAALIVVPFLPGEPAAPLSIRWRGFSSTPSRNPAVRTPGRRTSRG